MPAPGDHRPDDTITTPTASSLADDLLTPTDTGPDAETRRNSATAARL